MIARPPVRRREEKRIWGKLRPTGHIFTEAVKLGCKRRIVMHALQSIDAPESMRTPQAPKHTTREQAQ